MATDPLRRVLLRSLPAILFLLLALVAAPQRSAPAAGPVTAAPVTAASSAEPTDQEPTGAEAVPADRTTVLRAQFTAGVRGSRAPPAASV